jgi:hypothetical protein
MCRWRATYYWKALNKSYKYFLYLTPIGGPWYYQISQNFHTLVILLQVDLAFGNELGFFYEGFYKIEKKINF